MNTDNARFVYTAKERALISDCAPRGITDDHWRHLETIAADYLGKCFWGSLTKGQADPIKTLAWKLELQLKKLSPDADAEENGRCRWSPEVSVLLKLLSKLQVNANYQPKSQRKKSNKARPDALDGYLTLLVQFFMDPGGRPSTDPSGPCADFVLAAGRPVLAMTHFKLDGNAISDLIRNRVWMLAESIAAPRPQLGAPNLSIDNP
jgi:hypothetical protein